MAQKIASMLLLATTLTGCAIQPGFFVSADASIAKPIPNATDWRFTFGGKERDNVGQVTLKAGYALTPQTDIYAGLSHLSLADYGQDIGYNAVIVGLQTRKQW
jgi:hypothetical protein